MCMYVCLCPSGEVDHFDLEEQDFQSQARSRLEALSSCFAQLTHKAQTIFQANAKLEVSNRSKMMVIWR